MAATPLEKVFGNSQVLSRLQDHARRLQKLQSVVDSSLPPNLRGLIAVANFHEGTLTLHLPSPALATRINMSSDTIKADLLAQGELVTSIQTRVRAVHRAPTPDAVPPRRIGGAGRQALEALRAQLKADDPLADALAKVLERSRTA